MKTVTIHSSDNCKILRFGAVTNDPTSFTVAYGVVRYLVQTPVGAPLPSLLDVARSIAEAGDFDGEHTNPEPQDGWEVALTVEFVDQRRNSR